MRHYIHMRHYIQVIGYIWMPRVMAAQTQNLDMNLQSVRDSVSDDNGNFTRESVQRWIETNMGDFSEIVDFTAYIYGAEIPWNNGESELTFNDLMLGSE